MSFFPKKNIKILGANWNFGQKLDGVENSPKQLISTGFINDLKNMNFDVQNLGNVIGDHHYTTSRYEAYSEFN